MPREGGEGCVCVCVYVRVCVYVSLVRHVDAQFGRRHKVLSRTLCDHHACLLAEHGGDFGRLVRGHLLGHLGVLVMQVVGDVPVLPEEGEQLQEELTEVLAYAKPPC